MREILLICDAFTQVALDVEHFHRFPSETFNMYSKNNYNH